MVQRWCVAALCSAVLPTVCLALGSAAAQYKDGRPMLEDYRTAGFHSGPVRPVDLASHPRARMFRTRLREGATPPPDFAGHYKIVNIGCGTSCQENVLVDLQTGRVYFGPMSGLGTAHRVDSALLIVNPPEILAEAFPPGIRHSYYSDYYAWSEIKKEFRLVYSDRP